MQANAPAEWETVHRHYRATLPARTLPPAVLSPQTWRTIAERADIQYNTFFESLSLLPNDSLTLQTLYESSLEVAEETLFNQKPPLEASPVAAEPPQPPTHTWDQVHPLSVDNDAGSQPPQGTPPNIGETLPGDPATRPPLPLPDLNPADLSPEHFEKTFSAAFSADRIQRALSTMTQYGGKEGLRRLEKEDPDFALQLQRHFQKGQPVR